MTPGPPPPVPLTGFGLVNWKYANATTTSTTRTTIMITGIGKSFFICALSFHQRFTEPATDVSSAYRNLVSVMLPGTIPGSLHIYSAHAAFPPS